MSQFVIRQYHGSDAQAVWDLHVLALQQVGAFSTSGTWDEDFKDIDGVYMKNNGDFFVGTIENVIIAMGAIRKLSDDTAEIKRMRVHPDFQGRGYGRMMLEVLEKRAKELGYTAIQLDTTVKQEAAQRLYEKNKYQEIKRGFVPGSFETIWYRKYL